MNCLRRFLRGRQQRRDTSGRSDPAIRLCRNYLCRLLCSTWTDDAGDTGDHIQNYFTMISKEKRRNLILLDSSVLTYAYLKRKSERRQTNIIYKERPIYGEFHHLYRRLRQYPELFRNYTRMTIETFDYIVSVLKNGFTLRTTNFQRPISLEERLIVTLR